MYSPLHVTTKHSKTSRIVILKNAEDVISGTAFITVNPRRMIVAPCLAGAIERVVTHVYCRRSVWSRAICTRTTMTHVKSPPCHRFTSV